MNNTGAAVTRLAVIVAAAMTPGHCKNASGGRA